MNLAPSSTDPSPQGRASGITPPSPSEPAASPRLASLDALRGLDMAFIVGLGTLLAALGSAWGATAFADQFEHVPWAGLHVEDCIFPIFVFISGVSISFSLGRGVEHLGRARAALLFLRRCAVLFLLGVIYNGGFTHGWDDSGLDQVRWLGVLQRIALATLGAGLLNLWLSPRSLVLAVVVLLGGYWALLTFAGHGIYQEHQNIVNLFDAKWLPGRKYDGDHDPEGILSTLPAIASALLGVLAGHWLQSMAPPGKKAALLALGGALLLAAGWAWGLQLHDGSVVPVWGMPVIKKLWTSSFVLLTGGAGALLLALFYLIIDVIGWRAWAAPWIWIGGNSITIYLLANVLGFTRLAERFTGSAAHLPEALNWLPPALGFAFVLLLARYLHRKKVFIRV